MRNNGITRAVLLKYAGFALIIFGLIGIVFSQRNFPLRALSVSLFLASVVAFRLSNPKLGSGENPIYQALSGQLKNILRTWPLGVAITGLLIFSYYLLMSHSASADQGLLPLYLFLVSGLGFIAYLMWALTKPS